MNTKIIIDESMREARFDKALSILLPDSGLRLRRRLIESGQALLNGVKRKPGYKVYPGQEISLALEKEDCSEEVLSKIKIVERTQDYAAIFKPSGIHSAVINGSSEPAVEPWLDKLMDCSGARLVNRLDFLTSGILVAAFSSEAEDCFKQYENFGQVKKDYFARVVGSFEQEQTITAILDTDSRSVTKVAGPGSDPLRFSHVTPLETYADGTSLVRVSIAKGARHQIRAHLASCGHPIVGDPVYGNGGAEILYLHHAKIEFPSFCAEINPLWD